MYKLRFSRSTEKFLAIIQKRNRRLFNRFIQAFDNISKHPHLATSLTGNLSGYYSYRVGDYRILFEIEKQKLLVFVEKIEHRREVYK